MTHIQDTVYTGIGGTLFSGRITITSPDMTTADGRTVLRSAQTLIIGANGSLSVTLEPNDTVAPASTTYHVVYRSNTGLTWSERWLVPTSDAALKVHQVRITAVSPPPVMVQPTQLQSGGAQAGQFLRWSGTVWAPATPTVHASQISRSSAQLGDVLQWTGAAWEPRAGGGGGGGGGGVSLNGQDGPIQLFENDANIVISSADNVHTLGWSGQLPVSRGGTGGADPLAALANLLDPRRVTLLYETFAGGSSWGTNPHLGDLTWSSSGAWPIHASGSRIGVYRLRTTASQSNVAWLILASHGTSPYPFADPIRDIEYRAYWTLRLAQLSGCAVLCGLSSNGQGVGAGWGPMFEYNSSEGPNWRAASRFSVHHVYLDSGVPATTDWVDLEIRNHPATQTATHWINGQLVATLSQANRYNEGAAPFFHLTNLTPEEKTIEVDHFMALIKR